MKKPLLALHRYLGLTLAGFLVIAGITGSFLAFYSEFDALFNPDLYRIEAQGQSPASPGQLINAVEAYDQRIRVYYLPIIAEPRRASVVYVEPRLDPATQQPFDLAYDEVFIDPLTTEIRGTRLWGECCGSDSIIPIMHKLHNRLFLPTSIGRPLWGVVAILWSVMAVIGLVLTFPDARPRLRHWLKAWRLQRVQALLPQSINLHKAAGLWFWIIILAVALSGVLLGLERQVLVPMAQWISAAPGETQQQELLSPATPGGSTTPFAVDEMIATAEQFAAGRGINSAASGIWYDHASGTYEIDFGAKNAAGLGQGSLSVEASSGRVSANSLPGHRSLESASKTIRDRVHSGRALGLPGRILVFLCGWAVALLSITGVIIWYKRRARRNS